MPISADFVLDTSAALALAVEDNPLNDMVHSACNGLSLGLAGHALVETYSVLTRLPGANRLSPRAAELFISREFPYSIALSPSATLQTVRVFAEAGIAGGSVYDGLVGLAAREAGIPLMTCDRRALATYTALKVDVRLI